MGWGDVGNVLFALAYPQGYHAVSGAMDHSQYGSDLSAFQKDPNYTPDPGKYRDPSTGLAVLDSFQKKSAVPALNQFRNDYENQTGTTDPRFFGDSASRAELAKSGLDTPSAANPYVAKGLEDFRAQGEDEQTLRAAQGNDPFALARVAANKDLASGFHLAQQAVDIPIKRQDAAEKEADAHAKAVAAEKQTADLAAFQQDVAKLDQGTYGQPRPDGMGVSFETDLTKAVRGAQAKYPDSGGKLAAYADQYLKGQMDRQEKTPWKKGVEEELNAGSGDAKATRIDRYDINSFGRELPGSRTTVTSHARPTKITVGAGSGIPAAAGLGTVDERGVNPAALEGLDAGQQAYVKKMANYEMPLPTTRSKESLALIQRASLYNPAFDAQLYPLRQKLRNSFTSGPDAKNITSLNTAIHHLDSLNSAVDELHNTDVWGAPLWNYVGNKASQFSGSEKVPKVINAMNAVKGELAAVFKGTGATDQEIKAWESGFSTSGSPRQLKEGGVKEAVKLLEGRLDALIDKYQEGMGTTKDLQILSPKSLKTLQNLGVNVDRYKAYVSGPQQGGGVSSGAPVHPSGVMKFDKNGRRVQ